MLRRPTRARPMSLSRRGVASVELAVVFMFFVIPLMITIWEVGRLVQVQQIVSNSAREGARLAAQAYTIDSSGNTTQIKVSTGSPNVKGVVHQYLVGAGLTNLALTDVTVTFKFTSGSGTEPYQGVKNQPFTVTVSVPWNKVRWVDLGIIRPTTVDFTVSWQMLIDDAFTVNEVLPNI